MTDKQKRAALINECDKLKSAWMARESELADDDSLSEEEYKFMSATAEEEYHKKADQLNREAFYLQFPSRRGWFAETFVPSFGACENRMLSAKQTEVFRRYCVDDAETWRTGEMYCRAGGYMVKLMIPRYAHGIGYVTIA